MSGHEIRDQSSDDLAAVESNADGDEYDDLWRSLNEMASRVCSGCREFAHRQIRTADDDSKYHVYHPSMSSLQKSSNAGCDICAVLWVSWMNLRERHKPLATSTELWSIRCRVLSDPFRRRHVGYSHGAFCLQFYLWENDCNDAVRDSYENFPFATMRFFPAKFLGLVPDYSSTSRIQQVHPFTLRLISLKTPAWRKVSKNGQGVCMLPGTGINSACPIPRVGLGDRTLGLFRIVWFESGDLIMTLPTSFPPSSATQDIWHLTPYM